MPTPESILKKSLRNYAEDDLGLTVLHLRLLGARGWPDTIILGEGAKILFVEVKDYNKKPRKLQVHIHKLLKRLGFYVLVIDEEKYGKQSIKRYFSTKNQN